MKMIIQRLLQTPVQQVPGLMLKGLFWALYREGFIRPKFALRHLWVSDQIIEWELWLRDDDEW